MLILIAAIIATLATLAILAIYRGAERRNRADLVQRLETFNMTERYRISQMFTTNQIGR